MTDHPTLAQLAELDAQIALAAQLVGELRAELINARAWLESLRAMQGRAVSDYNRRAAGPLVDP